MATGGGYEIETDMNSSGESIHTVDIIKCGSVSVPYRIPSFSVLTVELKHVVCSVWDDSQDKVQQFDLFMRCSSDVDHKVPCTLEILESCTVPVEEFSTEEDTIGFCFPPTGVLVIWKWNWLTCGSYETDSVDGSGIDPEDNASDNTDEGNHDEPEGDRHSQRSPRADKLVFKCIGATKSSTYQSALRRARDIMLGGCTVPVQLVPEPLNPRDSRAIAFKCKVDDKWCTVGYIVSELVEEVHAAIGSGSIFSVRFAWVRYISDWSVSGPGFFAGVTIEKKGKWSVAASNAASTR